VQGDLNEAVRRASGRRDFETCGSGRTDAGVHALHQVAHLDLETRTPPEALRRALNDELPADINVLVVTKTTREFHARHSAVGRSYLYQIARRRTAFGKPFVWWVRDPLDLALLRAAGRIFEGMHDFRSFADADPSHTSTRVKVERVEVVEAGELVLVRMLGSHFLWKMVRRVVGVMTEVARGGMRLPEAELMLRQESDRAAPLTAPPSGLFLEHVYYPGETTDCPLRPVLDLRGP
jgi:tRNA pseudouridine38-40 synthase